jgi:L-alanine-DL-glutamate epimerase-like enolase superfamily enzyme
MTIARVESWSEAVPLSRPYTIAYRTVSAVNLAFVRLTTDQGHVGLGAASPAPSVTGETLQACCASLAPEALSWLVGRDPRHLGGALHRFKDTMAATPAARAAVDMAMYDLFGRLVGVPVVELLGRCHQSLPTSITIGIKSVEETLEEAREYLGRGFRCLKVKTGKSLDEDVERIIKLRELAGPNLPIRVDANQGYDAEQTLAFFQRTGAADVEFVEQPLPADAVEVMRSLPDEVRQEIAADESLHSEADALALTHPPMACGIYNIKLMKCGGITAGRNMAALAQTAGIDLMWGCNDESCISIAAALHVAFACPNTRYIDLDGSFDLARDVARGGFRLEEGVMSALDEPGLGVSLAD